MKQSCAELSSETGDDSMFQRMNTVAGSDS